MLKKLFTLFKLGRKLAKSDVLNIVSKFKKPPLGIRILFGILSFSFSNSHRTNLNISEGERLSKSLQSMGTTFIKLGQFLVTRPDIIGEELAKELEGLQDRLPAFSLLEAKDIIKKNLGEETFNSIINLSEPVAAASIAQVHKAQINDDGIIKEKSFREKVSAINWQDYNSKRVMIKGCTSVPVPTWAYLILTAQLSQFADDIVYGEPCSTVKIFKRKS